VITPHRCSRFTHFCRMYIDDRE